MDAVAGGAFFIGLVHRTTRDSVTPFCLSLLFLSAGLIILECFLKNSVLFTRGYRLNSSPSLWLICVVPTLAANASNSNLYQLVYVAGAIALVLQLGRMSYMYLCVSCLFFFVMLFLLPHGLYFSMLWPLGVYIILTLKLPLVFPNTFTFGETLLIGQLLLLFIVHNFYFTLVFLGFVFLELVTSPPTLGFIGWVGLALGNTTWIVMLVRGDAYDFINHLVSLCNLENILLVSVWFTLVVFAVLTVFLLHIEGISGTPYVRKLFHLLAGIVFVTGFLFSPELLSLASICAFFAFLVIEYMRRKSIEPVGPILERYLDAFRDSRDRGELVFTPIALLLGLALPHWLNMIGLGSSVGDWAGVITVVVGDSLAGLIGRRFGRVKWPMSHRTLEGSLASLGGQLMTMTLLRTTLMWPVTPEIIYLSVSVATLIEAYTTQIDNLLLPLCFMVLV